MIRAATTAVAVQLCVCLTGFAEEPTPTCVMELLTRGEIDLALEADGAHEVTARVTNRSTSPLVVDFPAGLAADAFAQNDFLAQFGQPGGMGQMGGMQGLGLLDTGELPLGPGETRALAFRSACLNFGIPEPNRKTPLFLKPIHDYTADPAVCSLVETLARQDVDTVTAQAAIWRVADGLTWEQLAAAKYPGKGRLTKAQLKQAMQAAASQEIVQVEEAVATSGADAAELAISIHPDPRGSRDSWPLAYRLGRRLQEEHPGLECNFNNYLQVAADRDAAHWLAIVRTNPRNPTLATVTLIGVHAKNGKAVSQTKPIRRRIELGDDPLASLQAAVIGAIAEQSIDVSWNGGNRDRITVVNRLPIPLSELTVGDVREKTAQASLADIPSVAAGRKVEIRLEPSQADAMTAIRRPVALSFQTGRL